MSVMLSLGKPPESNSSSPLMPVFTRSIFPTEVLVSVWVSAMFHPRMCIRVRV